MLHGKCRAGKSSLRFSAHNELHTTPVHLCGAGRILQSRRQAAEKLPLVIMFPGISWPRFDAVSDACHGCECDGHHGKATSW